MATAIAIDDQPSCFRFPRGNGIGVDFNEYGVAKNHKGTPWEVGCLRHLYFIDLRRCGSLLMSMLNGYADCSEDAA